MLPSKVVKAITDRAKKAFSGIGLTNGTAMPASKNNRDHLAWELYQAHELVSWAEARKKRAMEACLNGDLIFDHKKNPLPPGTEREIYSGEHVGIIVKVNNASPRFDEKKLKGVMLRHKIGSEVADKVYEECLIPGTPAHTFRAVPKVGE